MMKPVLCFLLFAASAAVLTADVPNQPVLTRYTSLWTDSLFTAKPPPPEGPARQDNPLDEYALGGAGKLHDGYYVVLFNKKDPSQKEVIRPGGDSDFEVVSMKWSDTNWKDTVATIKSGQFQAEIGFDDEVLSAKAAASAKATAQQEAQQKAQAAQQRAGQPPIPGLNTNNNNASSGGRVPRPRVVRPPSNNNSGNSSNRRGGR